ncbi:putative ABC transporter permease [Anaerotalea alkaliphila]|uniref:Putative ABC transporter permease n=1 Tax=Anaerotalea alkaliphila TaxID=2662126 RepID=A0A7X5HVD4_9FIRM|nr:putative ABC transporter permease [Anaerotalea alkaliphila]NDL67347.1 putative ABC transporter permease [Anaerotalea alkaliphila]
MSVEYAAAVFLVYGVLGWIWESFYVSLQQRRWVNRGFLSGPFLPIYAFGATLILWTVQGMLGGREMELPLLALKVYLLGSLVCTGLEYLVSLVLEKFFDARWWDYTHKPFNLHGRVCLVYSLGWGIVALLLWFVVHPLVQELLGRLPFRVLAPVLAVSYGILFLDMLLTLRSLMDFHHVIQEMQGLVNEMQSQFGRLRSRQGELAAFFTDSGSLYKRIQHSKEKVQSTSHTLLRRASLLQDKLLRLRSKFFLSYPNLHTKVLNEWIQEIKENITRR